MLLFFGRILNRMFYFAVRPIWLWKTQVRIEENGEIESWYQNRNRKYAYVNDSFTLPDSDSDTVKSGLYRIVRKCSHCQYNVSTCLQELKLLEYLFNYKRTADPSEYEKNYQPISEEKEMLCGRRILSEASQYRLPFHPLLFGDPWKIICKCCSFRGKTKAIMHLYVLLCDYIHRNINKYNIYTVINTYVHNNINKYEICKCYSFCKIITQSGNDSTFCWKGFTKAIWFM